MSLPLTRRIARAALLIAAAAAPIAGAAGAANAAALPQATDLSTLTAPDGAAIGDTFDSAGEILGRTAAIEGATPSDSLTGGGLPTGQLPLQGLPLG